jgi:hypothetical protein
MSNINPLTLQKLVATFTEEYEKFSGGNNSAGTRARKALQEVVKFARDGRKAIQEEKNARKSSKK